MSDETDTTEDDFDAMWAEAEPVPVALCKVTINDSPVLLKINTSSTPIAIARREAE